MCYFYRLKEIPGPEDSHTQDSTGYRCDGRQHGKNPAGQDPARDQIRQEDIARIREQHRPGEMITICVRIVDPVRIRTAKRYFLAQTMITSVYPRFCMTTAGITVPWIDLITRMPIDIEKEKLKTAGRAKGESR